MADNIIQVNIEVDDKGSVKVKQFGKTVKDAGNEAETGFRKARKSLGDFDQSANVTLGTIAKMATGLTVLSAAAAAAFAVMAAKSIKAASDLAEVQSKFNVVFAGQIGVAEAWARELVASYAMSTREAKQYLSSVQDLLVPMGMAADQAGVMSNEVVKLAADLGSFNNLPTSQVMDDIQSALVGNYETMKKYGVVLNAATVEQRAMSMGLAATKAELTAADKAQAAYALMIEGSTAAMGDMIRTQDGYANQLKKFNAQIEDLSASFGKYLLPIAADALNQINAALGDGTDSVDALAAALTVKLLKALGWVLEGMRFFHNAWLGIKLVGQAAITAIAISLEKLLGGLRTLMVVFDKIMDGMVAIGAMDVNPFDTMETALKDFAWSTKDQLSEVANEIDATNAAYDSIGSAIDGMVEKTEKSAEANRKASEEAAMMEREVAALERAAYGAGKSLGGLTVETEKSGKAADKAAKAWHDYQVATTKADSWMLRDQGMVEANKRAQEMIDTLSDLDALVSDDSFYDIASTIEEETKDATEASTALWEQFATDTGSIIENFVGTTLRGEFDSIGDMFEGLLDSMLSMLINFIAKAAAEDLINAIFKTGNGGSNLSLMNLFSSDSSSGRSSGIGIEAGTGLAAESGMLGKAGGYLGMAGGAYSMYSGAQDVGDGNYGTGAIKIGVGGYTAYKGAVTAGLIEEGTATKIGKSIGDYLMSQSSATGASSVGGAGASAFTYGYGTGSLGYTGAGGYTGGMVAEGGLLAGKGTAAAGGGTAAGSTAMLAGGVYAAAALIALKVAKGFIDGPSTKIDTLLNRDLQGRGMSAGALYGAFDSNLNTISDPLKQLLPSLSEFDKAAADMNTGILTLTRSAEDHGGTMAVTALRYDEQTGKMERLGGTMHTVEQAIASTGEQTGTLSSAFIQQIAATYSLESSTQALVEKYLGTKAAADFAAQGATQVQYSVQSLGGALGQFASSAVAYGDKLRSVGLAVAGAAARAMSFSQGRAEASYATGIDYVPRDMLAQIHRGERVLTAEENRSYSKPVSVTVPVTVGQTEVERLVIEIADEVYVRRQRAGVDGRAYI